MMKRIKLLSILFLLVLVFTPEISQAAYEIYTYGSGDFVAQTFHAINMLFGDGTIMSMIKLFVILLFVHVMASIFWGILNASTGIMSGAGAFDPMANPVAGFLAMIKVGIVAVLAVTFFGSLKTDVNIIDRVDPAQTQTVNNVPFVNAVVASYSSKIGDKIGEVLESTLIPPDAPKVREDGFLAAPRYITDIFDLVPPGAPVAYSTGGGYIPVRTLVSMWLERCILPNFAFIPGENSDQAEGLWYLRHGGYLLDPSGTFAKSTFRNPQIDLPIVISGQKVTCLDAPNVIISEWNTVLNNWIEIEGKKLVGEKYENIGFPLTFRLERIFNRYFAQKFNYDLSQSLAQIAILNELQSSIMAFDAKYGEGSLSNRVTERTVGGGWIQAAKLFGKVVLYMRQLFEALIYGLSVFLPIAFVVGGYNALVKYIKINFWLQLWVPGFVLINAFSDWQLKSLIDSFHFPDGGFSFDTMDKLRNQINLMLGYYGAFMWSIPALAWGLLQGSDVAMGTVMSTLGGGGKSQAESVGGQIRGMGNVSMGQQAYGSTRFMDSTMIGSMNRGIEQQAYGAAIAGAIGSLGLGTFDRAIKGNVMSQLSSGLATQRAIDQYGFESLTSARFAEIASAIGSGMTKQEIANKFFGGDIAKAEYAMSRLEALRRYGVYDAYQKGIVNEQDFIDFGVYFTKAQAGDVNAMKAIENITGKDFKDVQREIKQAGLEDSFQSAVVTAQIAQNLGIDRFSYFGQKHGLQNIALNEQMAQRLNQQMHLLGYKNFNAKAGDIASFSFDPSTGKFGLVHTKRGGASEFYDFKSALRGRQDVFKDLTVVEKGYREQSGTFVTRGVSVTQINEPYKFVGVYTAPDGTVMHGTFNYIKDKDGNLLIVSGSGSSTVEFSTYKTIELPNKFYGKDKYKVVDNSIYSGGGQPLSLLKSTQSGGESLILDRSKTFKGGYSFPGIWSMSAEQSGWEAGARILGAGESAFGSPGAIFVKKTFSANKKGGTKNP